MTFNLNNKW